MFLPCFSFKMSARLKRPLLGVTWCCKQSYRSIYSKEDGFKRDWIATIQQKIDLSPESLHGWVDRKMFERTREQQQFIAQRHYILGPDLATAHFMVARGASVKMVGHSNWVKSTKDKKVPLPNKKDHTFKLEAVDASGIDLMYEGLDNFIQLTSLAYLNLSNCEHIDDWCLDRLHQLKRALRCLDVSGCANVTERGLASLHKLDLEQLVMRNMSGLESPELTVLMLEDIMPNTRIVTDVDYSTLPAVDTESLEKLSGSAQSEDALQIEGMPGVVLNKKIQQLGS